MAAKGTTLMTGANILVVEDEPLVAQDIRLKLEELGYRITGTCANGEDAVAMTGARHPDLVLMDIVLEGAMNGIQAAGLIRDRYAIPVIYLTAYADDALIEQAKITDPFGYILKPLVARELHAAITLALYRAETTRKLEMAAWTSAALMSICDAVIVCDTQGLITDLNLAATSLTRVTREQAMGKRIDTLIRLSHPEIGKALSDLIRRTITEGEVLIFEDDTEFVISGNQAIPVHFSISPVHDDTRRALGAALVIYEDSARRKAEQALQSNKQQLDAIIENTTAAIYTKDTDGHYLMVNSQCEKIIGLDRKDIIGKTDYDLFPDDIATALRTNDQHVLQEDRPITFQEHFVQKDGTYSYISAKVPIHDSNNSIKAICGISTDITHQHRHQVGFELLTHRIQNLTDRLSRPSIDENEFYREICDGIRELIDADIGALPYLDKSDTHFTYLAATGTNADLLNRKSMPVQGGGLCGWVAQHGEALNVADTRCDLRVIPELAHALGTTSALVVPLIRNQRVVGGLTAFRSGNAFDALDQELLTLYSHSIGIALDNLHLRQSLEQRVSERTAQLTASNDELKAFSYSVSHDLRAPLRRIVGFSNVLLEDYTQQLDAKGKDYLRRVSGSAERMSMLIDDLMTLSRVAHADFQSTVVDLSAMAADIVRELQHTNPERRVEFRITPGMHAKGDPGLLRIVLENLFNNAWKFTRHQVPACIEFSRESQDPGPVYLIRDNGVGFDMSYADKLFVPFQRFHDAGEFEGTGIGLATIQRIIKRHNGRIWAKAAPGRGATFYFTLS